MKKQTAKKKDEKTSYSTTEYANRMGLSRGWIHTLCARGTIPADVVGGQFIITNLVAADKAVEELSRDKK